MSVSVFESALVAWLGEIDCNDVVVAGGKGASLSDMVRAGLPVPPGYVVCTEAFRQFLKLSGLHSKITSALKGLDVEDSTALERVAHKITNMIETQVCPPSLREAILGAYRHLSEECGKTAVVAVRSSAAAEDSQLASFAGQQETYLNVYGDEEIMRSVLACWGSFFHACAIFYRHQRGSLKDTSIAVVVQKMVNPEKSGVMFTMEPVLRNHNQIMIEAAWGLGEVVVSGAITPDNYVANKSDSQLISKRVAYKPFMLVRNESGIGCRQVDLPPDKAQSQVLTPEEIGQLLEIGKRIEAHFDAPQDVEWGIENGKLYVLQSRPITVR